MLRALIIAASLLLAQTTAYARSQPAHVPDTGSHAPGLALQESPEREPGPANLEEAIEIAIERYGGTAAGAETVMREGRRVHEIKVLGEDGSVRTVRIDPETGAIIPQERRQD